jgi:plasmid stabilization system protein ParE
MIVVITAAAEADLEIIADWIAKDNPTRAVTFIGELRQACETLSDFPYAFALVPRYEHADIRRRPQGNYLIFYRIVNDRVEILHVLNGARDYEAILFPDA